MIDDDTPPDDPRDDWPTHETNGPLAALTLEDRSVAKKKTTEKPLSERVEDAIRQSLSPFAKDKTLSEREYHEAVAEACGAIGEGAEMRMQELDANDDDGDE